MIYLTSAGSRRHGGLLRDDLRMLFYNDDDVITGWDFAIPIVGAAAVLFMGVHLYVTRRAQVQREQRFGESLRDQLGRRIAQLDYQATRAVRLASVLVIAIFVGGMALFLAGIRVNIEPNEPSMLGLDHPHDPHFAILFSGRRLVGAPPVRTGCPAAQAPAGGVAEGARCSVD